MHSISLTGDIVARQAYQWLELGYACLLERKWEILIAWHQVLFYRLTVIEDPSKDKANLRPD